MNLKYTVWILLFFCIQSNNAAEAPWVGNTLEGIPCTSKPQGYGPYDYTNPEHKKQYLEIVENFHFTPNVEQLISGQTTSELGGDISYTLGAFPNHHRALQAMARYQIQKKRPRNATYSPAECYFERALNFKPNDGNVATLYGIYLHKLKRFKLALRQYEMAEKLSVNNTELLYNMALLYLDLGDYKNARSYAIKAYEAGYPLQGVKKKLRKLGFWEKSAK